MTDIDIQQQLMDYLYDEMNEQERDRFERKLTQNPELQRKLEGLQSAQKVLQSYSAPEWKLPGENDSSGTVTGSGDTPRRVKYVLSAAAIILIGAFIGVFASVQIGQTEQGYYLTFGEPPVRTVENQGFSEEEVAELIQQIREENAILMNSMFEQVQAEQKEQFNDALLTLVEYYEERRNRDLLLFAEGLNQLNETTSTRFRQTNQTLNGLIYALSNE